MKVTSLLIMSLISSQLFACKNNNVIEPINNSYITANTDTMKIKITVGTNMFTATVYSNSTATAFKAKLPMTFNMTELNENEKYFDLPESLPMNASNPGTIQTGDLMLYGSNTLVLFYKTFSTSYNYTRLAQIDNPLGLAAALGSGNVTVTFAIEQ